VKCVKFNTNFLTVRRNQNGTIGDSSVKEWIDFTLVKVLFACFLFILAL